MTLTGHTNDLPQQRRGPVISELIAAFFAATTFFLALAVVAGYIYLTRYMDELGLPRNFISYSPHEYALAATPIFLGLALAVPATIARVHAEVTSADLFRGAELFGLKLRSVAGWTLMVSSLGLLFSAFLGMTELLGFLDDASPTVLRALNGVIGVSFMVTAAMLPLLWEPRRVINLLFAIMVLIYAISVIPFAFATIDARLTLIDDRFAQRATISVFTSGSPGEAMEVEGSILMIRSDNLFFLTDGDPEDRSVEVVPMERIEKITYLR